MKCKCLKTEGDKCRNNALKNSDYCHAHKDCKLKQSKPLKSVHISSIPRISPIKNVLPNFSPLITPTHM